MELALDDNFGPLLGLVDVVFQSLFSWNLLLMKEMKDNGRKCDWMFQSLFSWNLLLMYDSGRCWSHPDRVSILVFVELALDDRCEGFYWALYGVSILVFVELALDDGTGLVEDSVLVRFQSLFSWNLLLMMSKERAIALLGTGFNPCFRGTCS